MNSSPANFCHLLEQWAQTQGDASAIVETTPDGDRITTFAELAERAAALAGGLHLSGFRAGMTVLVAHPVEAALYVILLALWRLGCIVFFPDFSSNWKTLVQSVGRVRPQAVIGVPGIHALSLFFPNRKILQRRVVTRGWWPGARPLSDLYSVHCTVPIAPVPSEQPALLSASSGSTGQPKILARSFGFLHHQHQLLEKHLELRPGLKDWTTLPVFLLANLGSGVTSILPPGQLSHPAKLVSRDLLRQFRRWQPEQATAAPMFWQRLLAGLPEGEKLESLQRIHTGGAPVTPDFLLALRSKAPRARVIALYGSSEAEPIAQWEPDLAELAAACQRTFLPAGRPCPEIRLAILRDRWGSAWSVMTEYEFAAHQLPAGEIGEIVVSGHHVLPGYWEGIGDAETKFRVGGCVWHRTGDAGFLDENGILHLAGRCAASVKIGDRVVYPQEVEGLALRFPEVTRIALIRWDDIGVAVVEMQASIVKEVRRRILQQLKKEILKIGPLKVTVVPRIPLDRRHNSKIDYPATRKLLAKHSASIDIL